MYENAILEISQNLQALGLQVYMTQVFPCEFCEVS